MSKNLSDVREIAAMWQAARLALMEAESILLFGFSMPTSDERPAQPEEVLERFETCLPFGMDVETAAFPVQKGETPIWFEVNNDGAMLRLGI